MTWLTYIVKGAINAIVALYEFHKLVARCERQTTTNPQMSTTDRTSKVNSVSAMSP